MVFSKYLHRLFHPTYFRTLVFISIIFLCLALPVLIILLSRPSKSEAAWYDEGWLYRKSLTFTHNAALTNQQVQYSIDTSTLITNGQMQSDCGDSRFTDSNGSNLSYYLVSGCNSGATLYNVFIPIVNNGTTIIYHYYGNPSAPNGTETNQLTYPTLSPSGGAATAGSEEQGPGPILYWKFDEKGGTTANDSTPSKDNGTINNNVLWKSDQECIKTGCVFLPGGTSGDGDMVNAGSLTPFSKLTTGTVSFWAKITATNAIQDVFSLYRGADTTSTGVNLFYDNRTSGGNNIMGEAYKDGGAQKWQFTVSSTNFNAIAETNKWHLYTLTHNGTTPALFIDGKSIPITFTVSTDKTVWFKAVLTDATSKADNLRIGNQYANSISINPATGYIDDFKIYPYTRSASQITTDYNSRGSTKGIAADLGTNRQEFLSHGLVGYWKLDNSLVDSSGNSQTLSIAGGSYTTGKYGRGRLLSAASNEFMYTTDDSQLSITGDLTLSAWIKPSAATASTRYPITGKSDGSNVSYLLEQYGAEIRMYIGSPSNYVTTSGASLTTGTWYNVIGVYSAINRTVNIYINGQNTTTTTTGSIPSSISDNADNFNIGTNASSGTTVNLQVGASNDDGSDVASETNTFHTLGNCDDSWTNSTITTTGGTCPSASAITAGYRFTNVTVPQGSVIISATFDLYNKFGGGYSTHVKNRIYGSKLSNLSTFGNTNLPRDITRTTAYADWNSNGGSAPSNSWFSVTAESPPSVTTIIQEIVNQGSWSSGNALGLIFTDNGSDTDWWFEPGSYDGDPTTAGKLVINYGSISANYYSGVIDDVKVYNRALSSAEVKDIFTTSPEPIAWWKLDENTGTSAIDFSGNGNTGTLTNAPIWSVGKYGSGLLFNGTNNYVTIPDTAALEPGTQNWSVSLWANPSNTNQTSPLFTKRTDGGAFTQYSLYICGNADCSTSGKKLSGFFMENAGTSDRRALSTADVADGKWHHFAMTVNQDLNSVNIYEDGIPLANTATRNGSWPNITNTDPVRIGNDNGSTYYSGNIDDVKIYNYARTPLQIIEDMNGGHPVGGSPIGSQIIYTKFDEQNGTTANNSGYGTSTYNGTISNSLWLDNTRCKTNGCIALSNTNSNVSFGNIDFIDGTASMSASLWINPQAVVVSKMILSKANTATQRVFSIKTDDSTASEIRVSIASSGSDTTNYCVTSGFGLIPNSWQQLIVNYDGSQTANNRIKVYKNARQITCTVNGTIPLFLTSGMTSNFKLGQGDDTGISSLNAYIDEFKFYVGTLSQDTINIDYNQGAGINFNTGASPEASQSADSAGNPPIAYWNFDQNTGLTAKDLSGNGLDGTLTNGPKWSVGKVGPGISFDGVNDYITVPDNPLLEGFTSMTVCAWAYLKNLDADGSNIVLKPTQNVGGAASDPWNVWALYVDPSGHLDFHISTGVSGSSKDVNSSSAIQLNRWNYLCGGYTGTAMALAINGRVDSSITLTSLTVGTNSQDVRIGAWMAAGFNDVWSGYLDEIKIYNYARTAGQIAYDYNRGAPVGWWKFDECQGSTFYDSSGNGNNGTWNGITTGSNTAVGTCNDGNTAHAWFNGVNGKFNSSLDFDGSNDYVSVTDPGTNSNLDMSSSFSTSLWVNFATLSGNDKFILTKGDATVNNYYTAYSLVGGDGGVSSNTLTCGTYNGSVGTEANLIINLNTSQWYNVVCAFDDVANTYKLYLNGILRQTNSSATIDLSTTVNNGELRIGRERDTFGYYVDGKIDDVRLYNYPLSASQVQKIYNDGSGTFFGPATGSP